MAEPRNFYEAHHARLRHVLDELDALRRDSPCCDGTGPCPHCERYEQAIGLLAENEAGLRAGIDRRHGAGREDARWAG